jgi:hypothetical protein
LNPAPDIRSPLIEHLRSIAGAAADATVFTVAGDPGSVPVRVQYWCNKSDDTDDVLSETLVLLAPYGIGAPVTAGYRGVVTPPRAARPLEIVLRGESADDRRNKDASINREVQTGDAAFDDAVYVDTATRDDAVLFVLSPPEVRSAVRFLLVNARFARIVVDTESLSRDPFYRELYGFEVRTDQVEATLKTQRDRVSSERAMQTLEAFRSLVHHLPTVESEGQRPLPLDPGSCTGPKGPLDAGTRTLRYVSVAFVVGFVLAAGVWVGACVRDDDLRAPAVFGAVGALLGAAVGRLVIRSFRGRSNSAAQRGRAMWLLVLIGAEMGTVVSRWWRF